MPMPGWWKKTGKSKDEQNSRQQEADSPQGKYLAGKMKLLNKIEWSNRYSDDASISRSSGSSRSRELPTRSHRFSGIESDWAEKRDLPLPRPSVSDLPAGMTASASNSVSSVSSSGSSAEDHAAEHTPSQSMSNRGIFELKPNAGLRNPDAGPTNFVNGARSPAAGSRTTSRPTSPLHPKLMISEFESFTLKCEESKKQLHPLPLPPNSPTSPPPPAPRPNIAVENSPVSPSTWKKGKLLGRGTFGHVYLGFNSVSGQMCAIKEVKLVSDDQSSKECLKQLNQEINLLSQLSHPHIVRYYGSELSNKTLSVYLEYVSGGSIYKLLQEYGPFKEPVIQNYTKQILLGLAYLHGRNTVHRDIKGANILVDPNGEIKLADFGMAKHITNCSSVLSFKGSPYWMAPEVVMNTNGYSLPVDIWSLGCTIIEMATSKPPWSQYEGVAAIFKIGNSREIPEIPAFLSATAKSFVKLCLQRDPSLRPTALQLLEHAFLRSHGDSSPSAVFSHRFETEQRMRDAALRSPRDDVRKMVSLPVSPSASPLRQWGGTRATPLLSPPHPAFAFNNQKATHRLVPTFTYPSDVYSDATFLKPQPTSSSPSRRL